MENKQPLGFAYSGDANGASVRPAQAPQLATTTLPASPRRKSIIWAIVVVAALVLLAISIAWIVVSTNMQSTVNSQFDDTSVDLSDDVTSDFIDSEELSILGQLNIAGGFRLVPSAPPTGAKAGQLYYDQSTNTIFYFNGTEFVEVTEAPEIQVGTGLDNTTGIITNAGVISLQGQTGALTLTGGNGITVAGTALSMSGTFDGDLDVTGGLSVSAVNASSASFDSLSLGVALPVAFGGTGATSLTLNGVLIGQGTSAISAVTASGAGQCFLSTSGAPAFAACPSGSASGVSSLNGQTGVLTLANASGAASTVTIDDASTTAKGIAQFNATNFTAASGTINTIQDIHTGASPTFTGLTLSGDLAVNGGDISSASGLTIVSGANVTIGASDTTGTLLVIDTKTSAGDPTGVAGGLYYNSSSAKFRCYENGSWKDCIGTGTGVTTVGTIDSQAKSADGAVISGTTIYMQTADDSSPGLVSTGSQTFAGTKTFSGNIVVQGTTGLTFNTGAGGDITFANLEKIDNDTNGTINLSANSGALSLLLTGTAASINNSAGNLTIDSAGTIELVDNTNVTGTLGTTGIITVGDLGAAGSTTLCRNVSNQIASCSGGTVTLQQAYDSGNTISTDASGDIAFTLNGQDFTVTTAANTAGFSTLSLADGANASPPAQLLLIDNLDGNQVLANGLTIRSSGGGITDGIDLSDAELVNAINVGDNVILGGSATISFTAFGVANTGNIVTIGDLALNGGDLTTSAGALRITPNTTVELQATTNVTGNFTVSGTSSGDAMSVSNSTSTGNIVVFKDNATNVATIADGGAATLQNSSNSENALRLLNSAGHQLLNIGTVHNASDLITNGSLETDTTGWAAKGSATISRITSQQYVGVASLQVATTAASGDGARYNITLSSSTEYTVSFYAKLASGSFSNMSFGYSSDGIADTDCKTNQSVVTGGWQSFNCTFTTGTVSGTPYFYWKQNSATARTVYVDALQLVPGPDIGAYYDGKINTGGLIFSGPVAVQNDNDSNSPFQVQTASGITLFGVDAVNKRVGVNLISPSAALHVLSLGTSSVTALFNQNGSSSQDILQLQQGGDTTVNVNSDGLTTFQNLANSTTAFRILRSNATFGSGTPLFVADTSNSLVYIGNPTGDTTGALLVLDTKTSSGDPTGVAGGMYYNSNSAKFRCYENSAWRNCLGLNENLTFNGTNGDGSASLWGSMPAALTELWGRDESRILYDLTDTTQVRLQVNVATAGAAGSKIRAQYSTDQSSWNYLDGGTGPSVAIDSTGFVVSSWVNLTAGAKADVYLRIVGIDGDGAASPRFGHIQLQVR